MTDDSIDKGAAPEPDDATAGRSDAPEDADDADTADADGAEAESAEAEPDEEGAAGSEVAPTGGQTAVPASRNRRGQVRDKARQMRERQRKRALRTRVILSSVLGVVVIAAIVIVVGVVVSSIRPATDGPKNMASDGIVIGEDLVAVTTPGLAAGASPVPADVDPDVAQIRVYTDYLCSLCGDFASTNAAQIEDWLGDGAAVYEIHPLATLTGRSAGTEYSLRAANAAACVANYSPDSYFAFDSALYANQPEEGTAGLDDDELAKLARSAGASSSVDDCISETRYRSWVQAATQRALDGPLPGTSVELVSTPPLVLVNGIQYTGSLTDPDEFKNFVVTVLSTTQSTATPTPEPTGTDDAKETDEDSGE